MNSFALDAKNNLSVEATIAVLARTAKNVEMNWKLNEGGNEMNKDDFIGKRLSDKVGAIQYRCPYCQKPHLDWTNAVRHFEQVHLELSGVKEENCDVCGKEEHDRDICYGMTLVRIADALETIARGRK